MTISYHAVDIGGYISIYFGSNEFITENLPWLTTVDHDDDYVGRFSYRVLISLGDFDIRSKSDFNSPTFS